MSKKRQVKQQIMSTSTGGRWADSEEPPREEPQYQQSDYSAEESRSQPRQSYDDEGRGDRRDISDRRRPYGSDGRGYQNPRDRDRHFREQDEDQRNRFTTGGSGRGFGRGGRDDGGRRGGPPYRDFTSSFTRSKPADELPTTGPFIVEITNFPPDTDEIGIGTWFEEKKCQIEDVELTKDKQTFILTLHDQDSLRKALAQDREEFKEYSLRVNLKRDESAETYKPPSGAARWGAGEEGGRGDFGHHDGGYGHRDREGYGREGYGRDREGYGRDRDSYSRYPRGGRGRGRGGFRGGRGGYGDRRGGFGGGGYGYDRRSEPSAESSAPAEPIPKGKNAFTVKVEKHTKQNPFGDATPKDIPN